MKGNNHIFLTIGQTQAFISRLLLLSLVPQSSISYLFQIGATASHVHPDVYHFGQGEAAFEAATTTQRSTIPEKILIHFSAKNIGILMCNTCIDNLSAKLGQQVHNRVQRHSLLCTQGPFVKSGLNLFIFVLFLKQ